MPWEKARFWISQENFHMRLIHHTEMQRNVCFVHIRMNLGEKAKGDIVWFRFKVFQGP